MSIQTDTLLDRELPDDYRREWTTQIASEQHSAQQHTQSVFVFRIGTEWLALPASVMHAVLPRRSIRSIPHHRDGTLLGLATLRGQIYLCISLAKLLGITVDEQASAAHTYGTDAHTTPARFMIIGTREDRRVVCPVDEVYGIVRYAPDMLQELPPTLASGARYTTALLPWEEHLVTCLDGTLVLYAIDRVIA